MEFQLKSQAAVTCGAIPQKTELRLFTHQNQIMQTDPGKWETMQFPTRPISADILAAISMWICWETSILFNTSLYDNVKTTCIKTFLPRIQHITADARTDVFINKDFYLLVLFITYWWDWSHFSNCFNYFVWLFSLYKLRVIACTVRFALVL